ncbi:hypothetical protein EGW08_001935 [Elysia chlorotica]|uniref:Uncharacterized protein n=1 Tax=Elysia chlorotica TaxID=188477 RepID=A0A3S0ZZ97_ELYCH|nr:hypothetical protein EGW08_001935 [Elysia chlorotica]
MASPMDETISHDNFQWRTPPQTPSKAGSEKCEEKAHKPKKSAPESRRSSTGNYVDPLAASLAKLITVTSRQPSASPDAGTSTNHQEKGTAAQSQGSPEKAKSENTDTDLKIFGSCPAVDRPDWTATTHEMAKDLIYKKLKIAQDLTYIPDEFRFGIIESMGVMSPNSAYVIFQQQYHACRAMKAQTIGFNYCPLIVSWWHQSRYKLPLTDASDVKREDLLLSDGRLERNSKKHIAQIKREFWRKAAALSYDVSTFKP